MGFALFLIMVAGAGVLFLLADAKLSSGALDSVIAKF